MRQRWPQSSPEKAIPVAQRDNQHDTRLRMTRVEQGSHRAFTGGDRVTESEQNGALEQEGSNDQHGSNKKAGTSYLVTHQVVRRSDEAWKMGMAAGEGASSTEDDRVEGLTERCAEEVP